MKTLLYCQHSLGIGHLVRTILLATSLLELGNVGVIVGGKIPKKYSFDSRLQIFPITPLMMDVEGNLFGDNTDRTVEEVFRDRCLQVTLIVSRFLPDTMIVEMFPFGRKKFAKEIVALIDAAKQLSKCKIYSSVRDILVTTRPNQNKHDRMAVERLNLHFDAVLVHGDPAFAKLEDTFSTFSDLKIPVHYTGYIAPEAEKSKDYPTRKKRVVVSSGGGRVGQKLFEAATKSFELINDSLGLEMTLLAGSLSGELNYKPKPGLTVLPYIKDLSNYMAASYVSVSQCGYNTCTDVLRSCTPAVFVPFETTSETEQLCRAQHLADADRAVVLREQELTPKKLVAAIVTACQCQTDCNVNLDGIVTSKMLIEAGA